MRPTLWTLLVLFVGVVVVGCTPDLGDAPFLCNAGNPKCPEGYTCVDSSQICVPDGTCPEGVPGCDDGEPPLESCGNASCETAKGEDCMTCELDCGPCVGCGDNTCDFKSGETCKSCEVDCGKCECGNGRCDVGEDKTTCPQDCAAGPQCGNGACEAGETESNCPDDCAVDPCGNGRCDNGETAATCPQDCEPQPVCGDSKCELGETETSCPQDCKTTDCGNTVCEAGEDHVNCPQDCQEACSVDRETRCKSTTAIEFCLNGYWQSETCADLCAPGTSAGCDFSPDLNREVCSCVYAEVGYGEVCGDAINTKCSAGLTCAFFQGDTIGQCTKTCTTYSECTGGPLGADPYCSNLTLDSQRICLFQCGWLTSCPNNMYCDSWDSLCYPTQP